MSCCGCNRTPCVCVPRCETDCPEIVDYTFTNVNLAGVGVYSSTVSQEVQFKGIRSTNGNIVVANNAALGTVDLTISSSTFNSTQTFDNAAARALTVPDFDGQFGAQLDTGVPYLSTGTNAGDWSQYPWLILDVTNTPIDTGTTTIDLTIGNTGSASVVFTLGVGSAFTISTSGLTLTNNVASLYQLQVTNQAVFTSVVNFGIGHVIQAFGVDLPADSVFITSGTDGELSSALIDTFVSEANVQTYGLPSGTLARTTFASFAGQTISNPPTQAEVQAIDDALVLVSQRLAALITDLMATLKPHA